MRSVVLGVLCAVLPLVYSYCFQNPHKTPDVKFCWDQTDKTWHPVGSTWRNTKCIDCSCTAESMSCCSAMATPTGYSDKCTVEYDYTTCSFEVFEKKPCFHSAVGK